MVKGYEAILGLALDSARSRELLPAYTRDKGDIEMGSSFAIHRKALQYHNSLNIL